MDPDDGQTIYYNEREWRFIPFGETLIKGDGTFRNDIHPMLPEKDYDNECVRRKRTKLLHKYEDYHLTFNAADIDHIIVCKEADIPIMVNVIDKLKCSDEEQKLLLTRLISMERIKANF